MFLELKLLADVGVLGRPNVGKSALLARCSAARPRVGAYAFTTVEPVLGVVEWGGKRVVMMDVPGLVEGAHLGVGLGHKFLRHAERSRVYVHLLDGLSEDPMADFRMLNEELRLFSPMLLEKPQVVVVNKVDLPQVRERRGSILKEWQRRGQTPGSLMVMGEEAKLLFISAATGEGVDELLATIMKVLDMLPEEVASPEAPLSPVRTRRQGRGSTAADVRVEQGVYVVRCPDLEGLVALADTRDYRVRLQLWRAMTERGLVRQLEQAGIQVGDTIRIGSVELEWS